MADARRGRARTVGRLGTGGAVTVGQPLGLVAIEAIIRGVPVIASWQGGLAETVDPGRIGLLFPNGDEDALLECLRSVAAGPSHVLDPDSMRRLPSGATTG